MVVKGQQAAFLLLGPLANQDRDGLLPPLNGEVAAEVAVDKAAGPAVEQERAGPPDVVQERVDGFALGGGVEAPVEGVLLKIAGIDPNEFQRPGLWHCSPPLEPV